MRKWFVWLLSAAALAGEDFSLKIDGAVDEALVSLPEGHDLSKSWPAVFYYHGTSGRPTTTLIRAHTGEKNWIVVGMPYAKRGTFQLTPEGMDDEIRIFEKVRAELVTRAGLDPGRVYISGFSKGGWVSGLFLQSEMPLAGAAMLGAGHLHQLEKRPKPLAQEMPVFIGVGRHDHNYPLSLQALVFFRGLGAKVDMEAWRGIGHDFPAKGSPGLKEWLALQLGEEPKWEALEQELAETMNQKDDFERWWSLVELSERPAVKASEEWVARINGLREEMEKDPKFKREARILKASRRLLTKELRKKTLQGLEEIVTGYARLVETAGSSPQGKVAVKDYERAGEILDLAREQFGNQEQQRRKVEVKPTTERRRIPLNPLIR